MKPTAIITAGVLPFIWLSGLTPPAALQPHITQLNHAPIRADLLPQETLKTSPAKRNETEQDNVLRIDTVLVTVPVIAMDRDGKFVPNLQAKNFHVFEEGIEQEIAFFSSAEEPANIALLLDVSISTWSHLLSFQEAAINFVDQLRPHDRVMVITFGNEVRILTEATNDRQALRDAIRGTRTTPRTPLYDAVDFVINQRFKQIRGRKAIILFTDGVDTTSQATLDGNLRLAEESDVFIYPIQYKSSPSLAPLPSPPPRGGTILTPRPRAPSTSPPPTPALDFVGDSYLRDLARITGARLYQADDPKSLAKSFALILEELGKQYSLGYYPTAATKPGQRRKIKVTVDQPKIVVRARASYLSAPPRGVTKR